MEPSGPEPPRWRDEELVMISALEHWSYCPRQCALIHLEQTYDENLFTLRGNRVHELAHTEQARTEEGVRVVRGLPLWSDRLGLVGKTDVVEWRGETPYPVEYKTGKQRSWAHEAVQLCAQALCLEEMLGRAVPAGAVYYHGSRRRREIAFGERERDAVERVTAEVRAMLAGTSLPLAYDDARCPDCSLLDACMPKLAANPRRIEGLYATLFDASDL